MSRVWQLSRKDDGEIVLDQFFVPSSPGDSFFRNDNIQKIFLSKTISLQIKISGTRSTTNQHHTATILHQKTVGSASKIIRLPDHDLPDSAP